MALAQALNQLLISRRGGCVISCLGKRRDRGERERKAEAEREEIEIRKRKGRRRIYYRKRRGCTMHQLPRLCTRF